jgi:hypothetical protein
VTRERGGGAVELLEQSADIGVGPVLDDLPVGPS